MMTRVQDVPVPNDGKWMYVRNKKGEFAHGFIDPDNTSQMIVETVWPLAKITHWQRTYSLKIRKGDSPKG